MDREKYLERLKGQRKTVSEAIDKMESADRRLANGPLVGRYFKMVDKPRDPYPQYARVVRMDDHGFLYHNAFQRDKTGNTHVYVEHMGYHMQHWTRIPRAEYLRAKSRILKHIKGTV